MDWQIWHKHARLVRENKANPLRCPDCREIFVTRLKGKDDDLYLYCISCAIFIKPGLDYSDRVKAIVAEHYL